MALWRVYFCSVPGFAPWCFWAVLLCICGLLQNGVTNIRGVLMVTDASWDLPRSPLLNAAK